MAISGPAVAVSATGEQLALGPPGLTGPQGDEGPPGPQGLPGLSAGGGNAMTVTASYVCDSGATPDGTIFTRFTAEGTITLPVGTTGRTIWVQTKAGNEATYPVTVLPAARVVPAQTIDGNPDGYLINVPRGGVMFQMDEFGDWTSMVVR